MIIVYEGTPGSGKSYSAVQRAIENISKGRRVLTNMDGMESSKAPEMISNITGQSVAEVESLLVYLKPEQLLNFWEVGKVNDCFIIDEVQKVFNSRDYNKVQNRSFGDWASTHRHLGQDLFLISQRIERIESSVRSLAEFTYRFRKVNMFGNAVQRHYLQYCFAGDDTSEKPLTIKRCKYDPAVFACYSSYFSDSTKEKEAMKGVNILKHPIFYALAVAICCTIYFVSKSGFIRGDIFGAKAVIEKSRVVPSPVPGLTVPTPQGDQNVSRTEPVPRPAPDLSFTYPPDSLKRDKFNNPVSSAPVSPPPLWSPSGRPAPEGFESKSSFYDWIPYTALAFTNDLKVFFVSIEGGVLNSNEWLKIDEDNGLVYARISSIINYKRDSLSRYPEKSTNSKNSPAPRL